MRFQLFEFPTLRLHRTRSQPLSSSVELSSAHVTQLFSLHILVSCKSSVALKHALESETQSSSALIAHLCTSEGYVLDFGVDSRRSLRVSLFYVDF